MLSTLVPDDIMSMSNSPFLSFTSLSPDLQSSFMEPFGVMNKPRKSGRYLPTSHERVHDPVTYTPHTRRISKAKKGKRVHLCEYPGCNKVFTRAEHQRRHELRHNSKKLYQCTHPRCTKSFYRSDNMHHHMDKHLSEPSEQRRAQKAGSKPAEEQCPESSPVPTWQQYHPGSPGSLIAPTPNFQSVEYSEPWCGTEALMPPCSWPEGQNCTLESHGLFHPSSTELYASFPDAEFPHTLHQNLSVSSGLATCIDLYAQNATKPHIDLSLQLDIAPCYLWNETDECPVLDSVSKDILYTPLQCSCPQSLSGPVCLSFAYQTGQQMNQEAAQC